MKLEYSTFNNGDSYFIYTSRTLAMVMHLDRTRDIARFYDYTVSRYIEIDISKWLAIKNMIDMNIPALHSEARRMLENIKYENKIVESND